MSELFILSTFKYLFEKFTDQSGYTRAITLTSDVNLNDVVINIDGLNEALESNITLWFENKFVVSVHYAESGDTQIQIEPSKFNIPSGTVCTISNVTINDPSVINYAFPKDYIIIGSAEQIKTSRQGYNVKTFVVPINVVCGWINQEIGLTNLSFATDFVSSILDKLYTSQTFLVLKILDYKVEDEPFVLPAPHIPDGAEFIPVYSSRKILVTVEDYFETYTNFNVREFWLSVE